MESNNPTIAQPYTGIITGVTGGSVTIDIKGRFGLLKIPLRMLISQDPPQMGQTVRFTMSYPEVITTKEQSKL